MRERTALTFVLAALVVSFLEVVLVLACAPLLIGWVVALSHLEALGFTGWTRTAVGLWAIGSTFILVGLIGHAATPITKAIEAPASE